jgi:hypothetical protein
MALLYFGSTIGFLALISLVPLILLYLIKPNPKTINIPSLMFFIRSSGSKKISSFFRYFVKDWLFLLQFLILLVLSLAVAEPFSYYQHDITAQNTVIVIDVSASSQVKEGLRTRFDLSVSKAVDNLGGKNSIIIAKDFPHIALRDVSSREARDFLKSLNPRDTDTKLGDAILLAGEVLSGKEGRIIVISDFINTGGHDVDTAKSVLESKNFIVDFISVAGKKKDNVGIINIDIDNVQTNIYVKNFNDEEKKVILSVGNIKKEMVISGKSIDSYSIKTPSGVSKISLSPDDDFSLDNEVFIVGPSEEKVKVLLISNSPGVFIKNALEASGDIDLTITEPPVIPDSDFDVYVVADIDKKKLLSGTFHGLKKKLAEGASFIFCAQEDSEDIDYEFIPVSFDGRIDGGFAIIDQLNKFTKNVEFGSVQHLLNVNNQDGIVIASVLGVPILVFRQSGAGKIIYFGFLEEGSDFKFSPSYPIFWTELIKFLTNRQDASSLNFKTGELLVLDDIQEIKTPSKRIKSSALFLDEQGIYELKDRKIAVNLLNERESSINPDDSFGTKSVDYELKPVKEKRKKVWSSFLLIFGLILLFIELFYVKVRGDL